MRNSTSPLIADKTLKTGSQKWYVLEDVRMVEFVHQLDFPENVGPVGGVGVHLQGHYLTGRFMLHLQQKQSTFQHEKSKKKKRKK